MRRARIPSASQPSMSCCSGPSSPATTTAPGPLTAAMTTPSAGRAAPSGFVYRSMRAWASSAATVSEAMPPRPASSSAMTRLRRATRRAPAANDRAPATQAAAISPCEWPTTTEGVMPQCCQTFARETMTAHRAGCTTSTRSRACLSPRTSSRFQSAYGSSASAHSRRAPANTGDDSIRPRAMPVHWAPWPGKTKATFAPGRTVPETSPGTSASWRARPASPSAKPAGSAARTTARSSKAVRPPMSAAAVAAGPAPSAVKARSCSAWPRSAAADLAETSHGTTAPSAAVSTGSGRSALCSGSASGACSRMTWALVPLMPNEDTAARRGLPVSGQVTASVTSSTAPAVQSTCSLGRSACRVRGTVPCRRASTIFMTPAIPAAAWV